MSSRKKISYAVSIVSHCEYPSGWGSRRDRGIEGERYLVGVDGVDEKGEKLTDFSLYTGMLVLRIEEEEERRSG